MKYAAAHQHGDVVREAEQQTSSGNEDNAEVPWHTARSCSIDIPCTTSCLTSVWSRKNASHGVDSRAPKKSAMENDAIRSDVVSWTMSCQMCITVMTNQRTIILRYEPFIF